MTRELYAAALFTMLHAQGEEVGKWKIQGGRFVAWWRDGSKTVVDKFLMDEWNFFRIPEHCPEHCDADQKALEWAINKYFNKNGKAY